MEQEASILKPGKRIVLEGTDGTGKSTIADMITWQIRQNGIECIRVQEPGGAIDEQGNQLVPVADGLRTIIKDHDIPRSAEANMNLVTSSRFITYRTCTLPAINNGTWVTQTRDYSSAVAYQGYGEGYGAQKTLDYTEQVMGKEYMEPDFKLIFDIQDEDKRVAQLTTRNLLNKREQLDYFESQGTDYQTAVRLGYREHAKNQDIDIMLVEGDKREMADKTFYAMTGRLGINLTLYNWEDYRPGILI